MWLEHAHDVGAAESCAFGPCRARKIRNTAARRTHLGSFLLSLVVVAHHKCRTSALHSEADGADESWISARRHMMTLMRVDAGRSILEVYWARF